MKCMDYEMLISAYMDKELDQQETAEVERHLEGCEDCRRKLEDLLELKAALRKDFEETTIKPVNNRIIYRSIFKYFYFMFIILLAAFSITALAGGIVQQYIERFPKNIQSIFFVGIALILAGIFVMLYDILKELVRVFMKFTKKNSK